jgi:hypothetical protein
MTRVIKIGYELVVPIRVSDHSTPWYITTDGSGTKRAKALERGDVGANGRARQGG